MKRIAPLPLVVLLSLQLSAAEPLDIGSRRELMIDDHLIDSMSDSLRFQLHKPVRRNVALVTDADDSPHRHLGDVRGEIYLACAEHDTHAPPEMVDAFEKAMGEAGTAGRVEWYPGTEHGFAYRERPAYDKAASERHWERLHSLFDRNLRS